MTRTQRNRWWRRTKPTPTEPIPTEFMIEAHCDFDGQEWWVFEMPAEFLNDDDVGLLIQSALPGQIWNQEAALVIRSLETDPTHITIGVLEPGELRLERDQPIWLRGHIAVPSITRTAAR